MICSLRDVEDSDHEWLVDLHNDPLVLKNITHPEVITIKHHMAWWKSIDGIKEIRKIFCVDGERAGFCKFYSVDITNGNCYAGADLNSKYRGKKLAKNMWDLMLNFCFKEKRLRSVYLTTAEYNMVAIRVYHRLGFKNSGRIPKSLCRDGEYFDQICMYMLKEWYEK